MAKGFDLVMKTFLEEYRCTIIWVTVCQSIARVPRVVYVVMLISPYPDLLPDVVVRNR